MMFTAFIKQGNDLFPVLSSPIKAVLYSALAEMGHPVFGGFIIPMALVQWHEDGTGEIVREYETKT